VLGIINLDRILQIVDHRPWPLPSGPWTMKQIWHNLLFAHWPVPHDQLRPLVPKELPLDVFDGACWVGVVPFHMSGARLRGMPPIPWLSQFPELNLRTYVMLENKPGVFFFSLDAASLLAVVGARALYHLPYVHARMRVGIEQEVVHYSSQRAHSSAQLVAEYSPTGTVHHTSPGSLEYFFTERYCLYTVYRSAVYCCEIHHAPWPLQDATAEFHVNTMAASHGIALPGTKPLLHFARRQEVLIWPVRRVQAERL
jgi:uncharacterized protein